MAVVRRISMLAFTGALLLGAACSDDDTTGPSVAGVSGSYQATKFTVTSPAGSQDVLQSGGSVTTTFKSDGTLTGHVKVPAESVDEDFAGTWKLTNGKVKIDDVPTDIFVSDISFSVVGKTLVGDETFSGVRVQLTLTKR